MTILRLGIPALALLCALIASPVSAVNISQITWDVTGGAFVGPSSSGPVTGGTLTFLPAGGVVATPVVSVNHQGHGFALSLTGPSGSFQMNFPATIFTANVDHICNLSLSGFSGFAHPSPYVTFSTWVTSGGTAVSALGGQLYFYLAGGVGSGSVFPAIYNYISISSYSTAFASHTFTLGNEVRTVVPEPGTGLLLYLGLLGTAVVGHTAARRGRKARG